jgi:hypothetical protein
MGRAAAQQVFVVNALVMEIDVTLAGAPLEEPRQTSFDLPKTCFNGRPMRPRIWTQNLRNVIDCRIFRANRETSPIHRQSLDGDSSGLITMCPHCTYTANPHVQVVGATKRIPYRQRIEFD